MAKLIKEIKNIDWVFKIFAKIEKKKTNFHFHYFCLSILPFNINPLPPTHSIKRKFKTR